MQSVNKKYAKKCKKNVKVGLFYDNCPGRVAFLDEPRNGHVTLSEDWPIFSARFICIY